MSITNWWANKKEVRRLKRHVNTLYAVPRIAQEYICGLRGMGLPQFLAPKYYVYHGVRKAFVIDYYLSRWPEHEQQDREDLKKVWFLEIVLYARAHLYHKKGTEWTYNRRKEGAVRERPHTLAPFHDIPEPYYVVGCCTEQELEIVAPVYEVLADKHPKYAAAWLNKAVLRQRQGKLEEAKEYARKAVEMCVTFPDYVQTHWHENSNFTTMAQCYLARLEGGNIDEPLLAGLLNINMHYKYIRKIETKPLYEILGEKKLLRQDEDKDKEKGLELLLRLNRAYSHATDEEKTMLAGTLLAVEGAGYCSPDSPAGPFPSELPNFDDWRAVAKEAAVQRIR